MERLPASQFTEALNSATAMLETKAESLSSAADLGKVSLKSYFVVFLHTYLMYTANVSVLMFNKIIM